MSISYISSLRKLIGSRKIIHPGARVMILNGKDELLLIHRKDMAQWGMVAGAFEENESIEECIRREALEECGLHLHTLTAIGISTRPAAETVHYPNGDSVQYFTMVFMCTDWSGELLHHSEEASEVRFFSLKNLPNIPDNEAPSIEWLHRYRKNKEFILA